MMFSLSQNVVAISATLLVLTSFVSAASLDRDPRQIIPAANLQLYAIQGSYSPEFQATPATVITGWNNRTVNISSILAAAGPFGWPDKVRLIESTTH
jgi:hypothetical protein